MTNQPPAGWFPDPQGQPFERYWNGAQWTADTRQSPAPQQQPPPYSEPQPQQFHQAPPTGAGPNGAGSGTAMSPQRIAALAGAAMVGGGTLLPWATQGSFSENAFQKLLPWVLTGISSDSTLDDTFIAHGFFFVGLAIAALIVTFAVPSRMRSTLGSAGLLAAGLAVADFVNFSTEFSNAGSGSGGDPSVGIGLYLTALGGVVLLVGSFMSSNPKDSSGRSPQMRPADNPVPPSAPATPPAQQHPYQATPHHNAPPQQAASQPAPAPQPTQQPAPPPAADEWWN